MRCYAVLRAVFAGICLSFFVFFFFFFLKKKKKKKGKEEKNLTSSRSTAYRSLIVIMSLHIIN